jgi:hypothetical protein
MPAERRRPEPPDTLGQAEPVAPETRADLEPYLAELAGLRPADADAMPTADDEEAAVAAADEGGER